MRHLFLFYFCLNLFNLTIKKVGEEQAGAARDEGKGWGEARGLFFHYSKDGVFFGGGGNNSYFLATL